jgi:ABC-type polar amino acid transport system ATPase subunit
VTEILRTVGLEKTFGAHKVLRGIDLSVKEGETVAIIGPSGSGKSTLLRCLNRLEAPTAGRIYFEGREIDAAADLPAMRARMGMVFQHFNLFSHMTVLGNLIEAPMQVRGIDRSRAVDTHSNCCAASDCWTSETPIRLSSPAGRSSGLRSRAAWRWSRACCCSTKSLRPSTPNSWVTSSPSSATSRRAA